MCAHILMGRDYILAVMSDPCTLKNDFSLGTFCVFVTYTNTFCWFRLFNNCIQVLILSPGCLPLTQIILYTDWHWHNHWIIHRIIGMHIVCASTPCCLLVLVTFLNIYFFDRVQLFVFKKVSLILVSIVCMVSKIKALITVCKKFLPLKVEIAGCTP